MSTESPTPPARVTRFYTAARRIPILVGKLPSGGFIPGGPYTIPQILVLLTVTAGGYYTMPMWSGQPSTLGNLGKLGCVVVVTAICIRKIRWGGRSVLPAARGAMTSYTRGRQPRQAGRAPTAHAPRRMHSNILIVEPIPATHRRDIPDSVAPLATSQLREPPTSARRQRPQAEPSTATRRRRLGRLARWTGHRAHQLTPTATPRAAQPAVTARRPTSAPPERAPQRPAARSLAGTPSTHRQAQRRDEAFTRHAGAQPVRPRPTPAKTAHVSAHPTSHLDARPSAARTTEHPEATPQPARTKQLAGTPGARP